MEAKIKLMIGAKLIAEGAIVEEHIPSLQANETVRDFDFENFVFEVEHAINKIEGSKVRCHVDIVD